MNPNRRIIGWVSLGLAMAGCQSNSGKPFFATGRPTPAVQASADKDAPLPGMVKKKPFIAVNNPLKPSGLPTTLLAEHARSDAPVPLSEYSRQKTFALAAFDLRVDLSAETVRRRLGPPAAVADYADPWTVYRLTRGRELWLHFSQPDQLMLRSADIIQPTEDGYSRSRVFDTGLDQ